MATTTPEGRASCKTRRANPGRARSWLGASDSRNAGTPMVNHPVIVTWMGCRGNGSCQIPTSSAISTE